MGPHDTWWRFLFGHELESWQQGLTDRFGLTWLGHQPYGLAHVLTAALVAVLVLVGSLIVRSRTSNIERAIVPEATLSIRNFFEVFVEAAYGLMKDIMGEKAAKHFLPLIGTAALFIFFSNVLGLVPGFSPPTANLNTSLALAFVIIVTTQIYGVKEHGLAWFKHFLGPVTKGPWYTWPGLLVLMALMAFIELIAHFGARPGSLSIRLAANLSADHLVVGDFYKLGKFLYYFVVPIPMMFLGVLVAVVQTLVFCLLSTVYISMAVAHEEH